MPSRLRPKGPVAANAILVGDPGRALLLAQEVLEQPKMSNHARGLWGYSGATRSGHDLTIQATGMGGPSAAIVLADLAKLGVRRAIRIGTCAALGTGGHAGQFLIVAEAIAEGGSAGSLGVSAGEVLTPDAGLVARLREQLPNADVSRIASFDVIPGEAVPAATGVTGADMQTVSVLAAAARLGISAAAVLIATEASMIDGVLTDDQLDEAAKRAGRAVAATLSASS